MSIGFIYLISFALGLFAGLFVMFIFLTRINVAGTLYIDRHSDPNRDLLRFVVENMDVLFKKKRIVMKVNDNANLSQE